MTPDRAFEDAYPQVGSSACSLATEAFLLLLLSALPAALTYFVLCIQLQSVIRKILTYLHDFSVLFAMVSNHDETLKA